MTDTVASAPSSSGVQAPRFVRQMTLFESVSVLNSNTMWFTLRVEGELDLDKLRSAWDLLRQAHPVLTAQFRPSAVLPGDEPQSGMPGFDLVLPAEIAPAELLVHEQGSQFATYPLRQDLGAAVVDVVPAENHTLVSLVVSHGIADGRLGAYWNSLLWSYYTDVVEGVSPEFEPAAVPKPPEELLAERGVERVELGPTRAELATPVELPDTSDIDPARGRVQLSQEATEQLRVSAKKTGQTVHGLVTGAIAVAIRQGLELPNDYDTPIALSSPVDLRERLDPPVEIWGGTNVLGIAEAVVSARPDSDPVELGAEVIAQMREDLDSGVLQQSFLHMAEAFGKERPKIPQAMTTNIGALSTVRTPRGVDTTDFFGWVEMDWAPIVALMQAAGQNDARPPVMNSLHIISTYRGKLAIDFDMPTTPDGSRLHAQRITDLLLDSAARGMA